MEGQTREAPLSLMHLKDDILRTCAWGEKRNPKTIPPKE